MSAVGKMDRLTQNLLVPLFRDLLHYKYVGNWEVRERNTNIEERSLSEFLKEAGYSEEQVNRALDKLRRGSHKSVPDAVGEQSRVLEAPRLRGERKSRRGREALASCASIFLY